MRFDRSTRGCTGLAFTATLLAAATWAAPAGAQQYVAHLSPLNAAAAGGSATGEARFIVTGDSLTITVNASGLPKGITHWQHFHDFADGKQAACPAAAADANHDGIIDVVETGPSAGTTMVPFTSNPVSMDVPGGAYPKASATGTLQYRETVSLKALQAAFAKAFPGQQLDLTRRVVFIHGVADASTLKPSVASLGTIPAHVTLPIACGPIMRVR